MVHHTVNNLYRHGARVFYSEVGNVHVTGHAQRDELREMLAETTDDINFEYGLNCLLDHASRLIDDRA